MVTEEKALEEQNLDEAAKYLAKSWELWRNSVIHSHPDLDHKDFKEIIRGLKAWSKNDDPAVRYWWLVFIAYYVESDIENRFGKVFSDKLLSALSGK
jgi:hypothetical protein